jgi:hypothetical protein
MTIEQTVEIPASRRLTIDVPCEIPVGRAILVFTPVSIQKIETAPPNRKPISGYFNILSPDTYGDSVAYQRNLRDEWDD